MKALLDNDVLIKGSCYGLVLELADAIPGKGECGVLGAAKYIVPEAIRRLSLKNGSAKPLAVLAKFLKQQQVLEPTADDQKLATSLETHAQRLALSLDAGESQLVAMLILRALPYVVTGDKRAIEALEQLIDVDKQCVTLTGKVFCLEQVVLEVIRCVSVATVRSAICAEAGVDKAMTICFACHSDKVAATSIADGLNSYVRNLRAGAARALAAT